MITDLQKASLWKRVSAALCDFIALSILVVGLGLLLSMAFGYNDHVANLTDSYNHYETQYGVEFQISDDEYNALSAEKRQAYDDAYKALVADQEVLRTYNIIMNLTLLIITFSILVGVMITEFVIPMIFGNGQTLGKKVFGIGLMRTDSVRIRPLQLFIRTLLGKFTLEIMIPVYVLIMIFFNSIGIVSVLILLVLLIAQIICIAVTKTYSVLHDVLSGTVAVDIASQMIFETHDELVEYTKKIHAERAARSDY